jgi:predicted nucleic acid-binding protein
MILYYLDASAWIKRYCLESGSAWVADFFAESPAIGCSALGLVEVLCTFARKRNAREMKAQHSRSKSREAKEDFRRFYRVFLTPEILKTSLPLPQTHGLRGADTVHLASALHLRGMKTPPPSEVRFVTGDRELAVAARACGFEVFQPE